MILERELFEDQLHVFRKFLNDLRGFDGGLRAVGALEVGELDDGYLGVGWSFKRSVADGQFHGRFENRGRLFGVFIELRANHLFGFARGGGANREGGQTAAEATRWIFYAAFSDL